MKNSTTGILLVQIWRPRKAGGKLARKGYHAITQGYLIGEVVRRITGKSFGTYFKEEVAEKIGADFHVGVDPKDFGRIADLVEAKETADILEMDPDSIPVRVFVLASTLHQKTQPLLQGWRAEIPAANGHGNARAQSLGASNCHVANGGKAFGVELLSEAGCRRALEPQTDGTDLVGLPRLLLVWDMRFAMRQCRWGLIRIRSGGAGQAVQRLSWTRTHTLFFLCHESTK